MAALVQKYQAAYFWIFTGNVIYTKQTSHQLVNPEKIFQDILQLLLAPDFFPI